MANGIEQGIKEREEVSALLDTIGGGKVRVHKGAPRPLKNGGVNMYTTQMPVERVPELMDSGYVKKIDI